MCSIGKAKSEATANSFGYNSHPAPEANIHERSSVVAGERKRKAHAHYYSMCCLHRISFLNVSTCTATERFDIAPFVCATNCEQKHRHARCAPALNLITRDMRPHYFGIFLITYTLCKSCMRSCVLVHLLIVSGMHLHTARNSRQIDVTLGKVVSKAARSLAILRCETHLENLRGVVSVTFRSVATPRQLARCLLPTDRSAGSLQSRRGVDNPITGIIRVVIMSLKRFDFNRGSRPIN